METWPSSDAQIARSVKVKGFHKSKWFSNQNVSIRIMMLIWLYANAVEFFPFYQSCCFWGHWGSFCSIFLYHWDLGNIDQYRKSNTNNGGVFLGKLLLWPPSSNIEIHKKNVWIKRAFLKSKTWQWHQRFDLHNIVLALNFPGQNTGLLV